ncbi:TolC family protein, partial [Rubripirellula sp.]|nr:TolC family protein [Rubripirellula sp.]
WALRLACAQVTPNVTAQVGAGVDTGSDDTYAVLGVTVPLPIRNRNQGNIRAARASVAAASSSIERTRLDLEGRLAMAVGRYDTARRRYERLRDNVLPGAEETFELSKTAFDAGESNYLTLLTAQRTLVNTQLRILDALDQTRQASAEIDGFLVTLP